MKPLNNVLKTTLLAGVILIVNYHTALGESLIRHDKSNSTISISSGDTQMKLRVNYNNGCFIDSFQVKNTQVIDQENGISSAVNINNYWHLSKYESKSASADITGNSVTINNISYGPETSTIRENWTFTALDDKIDWHISRAIPSDMIVDAAANSHWEFADMTTWTGAILDNGAVAWSKLLPENFYTFGSHAATVLFWNNQSGICFEVSPLELGGQHVASRFTRSPKGTLVFAQSLSDTPMETRVNLSRCLREDSVWKPYTLHKGVQSMTYRLSVSELEKRFDLGVFNGIDENAVREILNTIARYGVIDSKLCGANGWRSGYICLHEQWYGQLAMAIQDENYTRNLNETYDNFRDNAVLDNGRVLARFKDNSVDAMPGTYTEHGFYEAQWGYLLDSQPDYVMVVAEQFHNTGDLEWARGQKQTCEAALEFMLKRDSDGDGLLEMTNSYHTDQRGSDWIDIIWAAYENALVNAEMYGAMTLWSEIENILGDHARAARYRKAAERLKESFNKDIADGGFWNPQNKWYVYWRDKDDSIHGDNLVIPVNFAAIGYSLCDDDSKRTAILSTVETAMQKEKLFSWPLCVYPYKREEGGGGNFPFPNYENGDIFLSWAELGTRCYAQHDPETAMKYISNIIGQYKKDGLAFQRYSRISQNGLGDDILGGNAMAVTGLYRNIFGIQPQYNRLYLESHLPAKLDNSIVNYKLRDTDYKIRLNTNLNTVTANRFSISDQNPFGINCTENRLDYFQAKTSSPAISFQRNTISPLEIKIAHSDNYIFEWTINSVQPVNILQTVYSMKPGRTYQVTINSRTNDLKANFNGQLAIPVKLKPGEDIKISVAP